jgi:outer membrane lipoprotein-sorting protein
MMAETRSTVQVAFSPGVGSRIEIETTGQHTSRRIAVADGAMLWVYDPESNRYTVTPTDPQHIDPRATFAITMAMADTSDFGAALAALHQRLPDVTVTVEGEESIAGRSTRIIRLAPYSCSESVQAVAPGGAAPAGEITRERHCEGFSRYWLDTVTGWMLRAEGDDGHGGGYTWETRSATFGASLGPDAFRFIPPPGSIQVGQLE